MWELLKVLDALRSASQDELQVEWLRRLLVEVVGMEEVEVVVLLRRRWLLSNF